jgi:hypothetical protein
MASVYATNATTTESIHATDDAAVEWWVASSRSSIGSYRW